MAEYCGYQWNIEILPHEIAHKLTRNEAFDHKLALQQLKDLICASLDFALKDKSCSQDDALLTRFLFARKFNVEQSFELVINYYAYRQRNGAIFEKLNASDEDIQYALKDGFPGVLPERDRRGRCVLVMIASNWDHCTYSLITIYRALLLSLEKLLEDKQNQANGFVMVVDWSDFTFRQSSNLNPKVLKLMIEGLQDCFPAKFKGIHFIAQPWYVEAALAVIRPFLQERTKERIHLHGNNLSTLHNYIAKDVLPSELGGEGSSFNPSKWVQILLDSGDIIKSNCAYTKNNRNSSDDIVKKPLGRSKGIEINTKYGDDASRNQLLGEDH